MGSLWFPSKWLSVNGEVRGDQVARCSGFGAASSALKSARRAVLRVGGRKPWCAVLNAALKNWRILWW